MESCIGSGKSINQYTNDKRIDTKQASRYEQLDDCNYLSTTMIFRNIYRAFILMEYPSDMRDNNGHFYFSWNNATVVNLKLEYRPLNFTFTINHLCWCTRIDDDKHNINAIIALFCLQSDAQLYVPVKCITFDSNQITFCSSKFICDFAQLFYFSFFIFFLFLSIDEIP